MRQFGYPPAMDFPSPLVRGRLIQRYKRFLADVALEDGAVVTAHVANPGAMLGLADPGLTVWLSRSDDPRRKLAWSWELVEVPDPATGLCAPVGVNTHHANRLVAEALAGGVIPELAGYAQARPEVRYGQASRIDFRLTDADGPGARAPAWVEVKSVTLRRGPGLAEWPDCRSDRAGRHLREMQALVAAGDRAVVLFVVQRTDCRSVSIAEDLDPAFAAELARAVAAGVEVLTYGCEISPASIRLARRLEGPAPWLG
jgi:sugar fermentation stimulation protein A